MSSAPTLQRTALSPSLAPANYQVLCVCDAVGFPLGSATAARITVIGTALQEAGFTFGVLHCGYSPLAINTESSGVYRGIPFVYTSPVRRPNNIILRHIAKIWAVLSLTARLIALWPDRHRTLIYLYVMDGPLNPYTAWLCRALGLSVIQELCEWLPGEPGCRAFTRWLHRKQMFRFSAGVLAISNAIVERVKERALEVNPRLIIHKLPSVVDAQRFAAASPLLDTAHDRTPTFVYCGTWRRDIFFLLRTFALVKKSGRPCRLRIIGGSTSQLVPIREYSSQLNLSSEEVVLAGCVDEHTLSGSYKTATALLLPLPNDDRSRTRMPNKLGEYLASARPVITCSIGDLTGFLKDGENAYLALPGDEQDFAAKMLAVLDDPEKAARIGAAGQQACMEHLDYRAYGARLAAFFAGCINSYTGRRSTSLLLKTRNLVLSLFAQTLIALGFARRARKRAFEEGVVTSIYFHKPNGRLFAKCISWLRRNGYTFVSLQDVLNMLHKGAELPRGAVWLSFDDGCKELLRDVLPILQEHRIPATLFLPTGIIAGDGLFPWIRKRPAGRRDAITLDEMQAILACPEISIGSHTVRHTVTSGLSHQDLHFELHESQAALQSWTGAAVSAFAFPEGKFDGNERAALIELGYQLAATTENAFITPQTDPYFVPRFSVANDIWFPEALCNMVGIWRPLTDAVHRWIRPLSSPEAASPRAQPVTNTAARSEGGI